MISIFNGKVRGLPPSEPSIYIRLEVDFRQCLKMFKGAKLHVFLDLALHADENGHCYPSYDTIRKHTGYGRDTIAAALKSLCETTINEMPVLMYWRDKDEQNRYTGPNQYIIFPSEEQLLPESANPATPQLENSTVGNSNVGKTQLELDPLRNKIQEEEQDTSNEVSANADIPDATLEEKPKKRSGKKTAYVNPDTGISTEDIFSAYKKCLDVAEPGCAISYGQEMKAARSIAALNWKPSDVTTAYWKMRNSNDFWKTQHLPLVSVGKNLGVLCGNGSQPEQQPVIVINDDSGDKEFWNA